MLRRTLDPAVFDRVANHPDVRPWLGGSGELSFAATLSDPANIALCCDAGGWLLTRHESGVYEAHSLFLPGTADVPAMAMAGFEYLFTATDCVEVVSKVPLANRPALGLANAVGLREKFRRPDAWPTPDGGACDVSYRALTLEGWSQRAAGLEAHGEWFHGQLEAAKAAAGSELPTHPHDPAHERAVGASVLMFRAGNVRKAVWAYNRWARLAGYRTIELLSELPAVVDVRDAIIEVRGESMEVLSCR